MFARNLASHPVPAHRPGLAIDIGVLRSSEVPLLASGSFQRCAVPPAKVGCRFIRADQVAH